MHGFHEFEDKNKHLKNLIKKNKRAFASSQQFIFGFVRFSCFFEKLVEKS